MKNSTGIDKLNQINYLVYVFSTSKPAFTFSKLTIETLEEGV